MQISEISNSVNFTCEPDPCNDGSAQAATRALVQQNGSARFSRAPQVGELRPEEPEHVRSEPKCLTAKSTGRRHDLVFLHAKDLANAIATKLGGGVRAAGKGWKCRCPAHEDKEPSLHLEDGKSGLVLASCFPAGMTRPHRASCWLRSPTLAMRFLRLVTTSQRQHVEAKEKIVAVYDYVDELGRLVFQVVRKEPKEFLQRRPM